MINFNCITHRCDLVCIGIRGNDHVWKCAEEGCISETSFKARKRDDELSCCGITWKLITEINIEDEE